MPSFYLPHPKGVEMNGAGGPVVLELPYADQLLVLYLEAGARDDYFALRDALEQHKDWIPDAMSFRRHAA